MDLGDGKWKCYPHIPIRLDTISLSCTVLAAIHNPAEGQTDRHSDRNRPFMLWSRRPNENCSNYSRKTWQTISMAVPVLNCCVLSTIEGISTRPNIDRVFVFWSPEACIADSLPDDGLSKVYSGNTQVGCCET